MVAAVIVSRHIWRRNHMPGGIYITIRLLVAALAASLARSPPEPIRPRDRELTCSGWPSTLPCCSRLRLEHVMCCGSFAPPNESLAELREAEVARAALEERMRLSRELHDGLTRTSGWPSSRSAGSVP